MAYRIPDIPHPFSNMIDTGDSETKLPAMKTIKDVELLGDYKLRINLTQPFAPIYVTVFSQMPILPKHIWEKIEKEVDDPKRYRKDEEVEKCGCQED